MAQPAPSTSPLAGRANLHTSEMPSTVWVKGGTGQQVAFERHCVNTVRVLANDIVEAAGSGHPGAPMALAPAAHVLWTRILRYNPGNPLWPGRDRFVLSNGHAAALLYSMLHLTGYDLPMEQLRRERKLDSVTAGHPENVLLTGMVEVTTGPLGQGVSNAVGMALAATHAAAEFNDPNVSADIMTSAAAAVATSSAAVSYPSLVDSFVYCFCGDGCMMVRGMRSAAERGLRSRQSDRKGGLPVTQALPFFTLIFSMSSLYRRVACLPACRRACPPRRAPWRATLAWAG